MRHLHIIFVFMFGLPFVAAADGEPPASASGRAAPQREDFKVGQSQAFVIMPGVKKTGPVPWVLYAPTLGKGLPGDAEKWMFERFLAAGIAIAGVDVGESYGNPKGRAVYNELHAQLVRERGFDTKACLLGRSRGGLMLYCWAAENADKVRCITGIYPVCNIASYPGIGQACGAYGMTEAQLKEKLTEHNPIDRLSSLAKAGVPILHIHGDVDTVVPLKDNSGLVAERYAKLGGKMELLIPKGQGHNMWEGFFQCQELVDFLIKHATGANVSKDEADAVPKPIAHWKLDDTGEKALDAAGDHHGVIHGAVSAEGKTGKGLLFDRAKGDHVAIGYSKDFDISTFTVSAWVKLTKAPTFSGILGTRFGGEQTFDMKVNADKVHGDIGDGANWIETKVNFYENDKGGNGQGGKLTVGTWYHITFVIDDATKQCRLYLDGDQKTKIDYKGSARLMTPAHLMHIGHSSGTEFMDGVIDDVRIWNRALTDRQVRAVVKGQ
jgi:hypothetical protein